MTNNFRILGVVKTPSVSNWEVQKLLKCSSFRKVLHSSAAAWIYFSLLERLFVESSSLDSCMNIWVFWELMDFPGASGAPWSSFQVMWIRRNSELFRNSRNFWSLENLCSSKCATIHHAVKVLKIFSTMVVSEFLRLLLKFQNMGTFWNFTEFPTMFWEEL